MTGVRAEYAHVDDEGWRTGRAAVLAAFLDRPVIFVTAPMQASEHRARANLAAELSRLRAGAEPVSRAERRDGGARRPSGSAVGAAAGGALANGTAGWPPGAGSSRRRRATR